MNYTLTNNRLNKTYNIIKGVLEIPIQGVWAIRGLEIDTDDEFQENDSVSLTFIDKTLNGILVDVTNYNASVHGVVVGGKNTMSDNIDSTSYVGISVKTIVDFICRKTGHSLDPSSNTTLLGTSIPRFESFTTSASDILEKALQPYNGIWRVTLSGNLYVGYEEFPDIKTKYPTLIQGINLDIIDRRQSDGWWRVYNEEVLIEPAFSIEGNQVRETIYDLNNEERENITIRLDFFDPEHISSYKLSNQSVKYTAYHLKYRMKVAQQKSDGTLTIFPQPDLPLLKNGLKDVPIVYTIPDMKVKMQPGAICYVEFANGDPGLPIVTAWDNLPKLITVEFATSKDPKKVARVGDTVDCGKLYTATVMGVIVSVLYQEPGSLSATVIGPIPTGVQVKGVINSGSNSVLAGS